MNLFRVTNRQALVLAVAAIATIPAQAANLVVNGSFNTTSPVTGSFSIDNSGNGAGNNNPGGSTYLAGWSTTPTNGTNNLTCLVYQAGNTNICGMVAYNGGASFWVNPGPSPDGGNYVAIDAAPHSNGTPGGYASPLMQTINGLVIGSTYTLTFYQAAAQQTGFSGATTDTWDVSLGSETHNAATMSNNSHGDVAWNQQTLNFKATSTSEVLSFLAVGTPDNNDPPFALLDGVSLTQTPEPGTFALIGAGLLCVPVIARRRMKKQ